MTFSHKTEVDCLSHSHKGNIWTESMVSLNKELGCEVISLTILFKEPFA
jgi:hypothetical protein